MRKLILFAALVAAWPSYAQTTVPDITGAAVPDDSGLRRDHNGEAL